MILSIIIPVYNVEKFVARCILSCISQDLDHSEYEIICINDGSTDNSQCIVEDFASQYPIITLVNQPNRGLSEARNRGMNQARGDYYMFLDSDDWIEDNCLGKLTARLKEEKPDVLAFCAADVCNGIAKRRFSFSHEETIAGRDLLAKGVSPCAALAIWKASFLAQYKLCFHSKMFV